MSKEKENKVEKRITKRLLKKAHIQKRKKLKKVF